MDGFGVVDGDVGELNERVYEIQPVYLWMVGVFFCGFVGG